MYIWYSEEGTGRGSPPGCTKCNSPSINGQTTNHRIAAAYDGPLLCGFSVPSKGLSKIHRLVSMFRILFYCMFYAVTSSKTQQVVWPPGSGDTVCPRPPLMTQVQHCVSRIKKRIALVLLITVPV